MSSCYITLSYHIISYLMFFNFISSADLITIQFYSILFYFISNRFDLILFYSLLLNSICYIVQYCISYQWMICVYLSVHLSVCVFICMNKFMFSVLSCFFILSLLFLFSFHFYFSFISLFIFISLSFLMNVFLTHTHGHGHGHTNTYEYMFLLMTRTYYFNSG